MLVVCIRCFWTRLLICVERCMCVFVTLSLTVQRIGCQDVRPRVPAAFADSDSLKQAWEDVCSFHDSMYAILMPGRFRSVCFESWPVMVFKPLPADVARLGDRKSTRLNSSH